MFPTTSSSGASSAWLALALVAAVLAAGSPAQAADRVSIKPSLGIAQEYDTNVLYSPRLEEGDSFTRVVPGVEISSSGERQSFRIQGELVGRYYRRYDELDAENTSLSVEGSRAITPRIRLFLSGDLDDWDSTDPISQGDVIVSGRGDLSRRSAQGGVSLSLDPLTTLQLAVSASGASYGERRIAESGTVLRPANDYDVRGGNVLAQRIMGSRDVFGLFVTYDLIDFAQPAPLVSITPPLITVFTVTAREERRTRIGLSWQHVISPTWSMSLRGGPRWLHTEGGDIGRINGVPTGAAKQTGDSLAFNGDITLTRVTQLSSLEFGYSRDTRPATDRAASENLDEFSISYSRKIGRRINWRTKALWRREESSSESSRFERDTMRFDAELRWRVRKDFHAFVGYSFQDQELDRIGSDSSTEGQRFKVGFRYTHDFDFF